jgi:beta-N-acetylhexosaminidase
MQLAGQRVIGSYPGLVPPASLVADIENGQLAGVIFFGENIAGEAQIAGVITRLRQAQARRPAWRRRPSTSLAWDRPPGTRTPTTGR